MREYEVTVVFKPDLEESQLAELQERLLGWFGYEPDQMDGLTVHHWGQRSLAYDIRNYTDGYYIFYEVSLDPSAIGGIERNILYTDEILRHLVVRKGS